MDYNSVKKIGDISEVVKNLESRGFKVFLTKTKEEALEKVKSLIPTGAEVSKASSTTLDQIGVTELVNSGDYNNISKKVTEENDKVKRDNLRRHSLTADYVLGGVNAITEDGKLVLADNTGSRIGSYAYSAGKVIIVSGTNKIVKDLDSAFDRIKTFVFPLETVRLQKVYGVPSNTSKWLIIEKEINPERMTIILVEEELGF